MSRRVSEHFDFKDAEDIIWTFCFFGGLCIVCSTILLLTLIIQQLHAIPKTWSAADLHAAPKTKYVRKHATLLVSFATICIILTFSTYPVCAEWWCEFNLLGNTYYIFVFDSFILTKCFLYLLFIGHLFDPHYRRIYQYPKSVQYALWMLLIVMVISMVVSNMGSALRSWIVKRGLSEVVDVYSGFFIVADCILSVGTTILLSYPICSHRARDRIVVSTQRAIVMKYGVIAAVQLGVSTVWRITFVIRIFTKLFLTDNVAGHSFWNICSFIQMVDCLILISCVYFGFARKQTVNCKSCCGGYELDHHDVKLVTPRRDRRNNSIDSSTLHDLLGDSNIQDNAFLGDRKMQMQDEAKSSISFTI